MALNVNDVDPLTLGSINFDDGGDLNPETIIVLTRFSDDETNLHRHAKYNAQEAVALAKERAQQFDTQAALERKTNEALRLAKAQAHIHDTSEANSPQISEKPLVDRTLHNP